MDDLRKRKWMKNETSSVNIGWLRRRNEDEDVLQWMWLMWPLRKKDEDGTMAML